ncbi:hypothetical protein [Phenylobacterium sp.]|jgi:hypothetical protein|uniref:hypothetical protein n=1 Tax=Phenylobacterium sp. TaxID=1871053 RepID=UPI0037848D50
MSVRRGDGFIHLEGDCRVEEAETLLQLLQADPAASVDISQCRHLHGAVAQVLLVFGPAVTGIPQTPYLRDLVLPNLTRRSATNPDDEA